MALGLSTPSVAWSTEKGTDTMRYMYEDAQGNELTYAEEMRNYLYSTNLFYVEGVTA